MEKPFQPAEIRSALAEEEFEYWYQPKVSLFTGRVCGGEALLRWHHPSGETLCAQDWIGQATEMGLSTEIALSMLPKLFYQIERICETTEGLAIAVNLTARDLEDDEVCSLILEAMWSGRIPPRRLQLEMTEAALPEDEAHLERNLDRLVETGIALAMDDFGTGFASLDMLRKLPFTSVKIDQGVVRSMQDSAKSSAIAFSSIRMAYEMGLDVVAEGVESEEIFEFLQQAGCNEAQGYWISEAIPCEDFIQFVHQDHRWSASPIGRLRHVEIDHIMWCKDLLAAVFSDSATDLESSEVSAVCDDHLCRMGQWLDQQEGWVADLAEFKARPHAHLHRAGFNLMEAANQGLPTAHRKRLAGDLNHWSGVLMHLLQKLEIKVLMTDMISSQRR